METVKLLVTVPATSGLTRIGDPGTGVEEGADWDRLAVILAYDDGPYVQKTIITKMILTNFLIMTAVKE